MNGLRLNGITKEDLEGPDSRTPYGRPKTVSGGPIWSSSEKFDLVPRRGSDEGAPAPTIKSEPRQQSKDARRSPLPPALQNNSRSSTPVQKQISTPILSSPTKSLKSPTKTSTIERPKTATATSATERTKPAYMDAQHKPALAKSHSRSKSKPDSPPEALPQADSAAANTAKRRSTINGSSPSANKVPPPPPVPESKQAKVSKRKSFLSAFRR